MLPRQGITRQTTYISGMDLQTLAAYTSDPGRYAAGFETLAPGELPYLALAGAFFHAGQPIADIGCGSGRDAAWLQAQGYVVTAYDASATMLAEAGRLHPELQLAQAVLPDLAEIPPETHFPNFLCSAVLMHLPAEQQPAAVIRLADLLAPGRPPGPDLSLQSIGHSPRGRWPAVHIHPPRPAGADARFARPERAPGGHPAGWAPARHPLAGRRGREGGRRAGPRPEPAVERPGPWRRPMVRRGGPAEMLQFPE